jgi:hypothetical protein
MSPDTRRRAQLAGVSVCWVALAVANFAVSERARWLPDLTGVLALLTALLTVIVLVRPASAFAYSWGGTCAMGTLCMRVASIVYAAKMAENPDTIWLFVSSAGLGVLLSVTYGYWWLTDIKLWHLLHESIDHGR